MTSDPTGSAPHTGSTSSPTASTSDATAQPASAHADGAASKKQVGSDAPFEKPGDSIGPYKLVSILGEGGFGTVWLAERREPMVQRVALKIIKPGMDSAAVVARFGQERQALAVMDHPNVARVFDGGVTEASRPGGGRPYFVMEYVKGEPITTYADRQRLTLRGRLELFVTVCDAVQHAHAKGIIHRDLKPSNILVEEIDGSPVVKVIDFGIAKAISDAAWARVEFTLEGMVIGTPEYMSPEQISGSSDIDTRSDVYALGVVLYELLTGVLPFESDDLRRRGFAEIQRIIREETPPKPSTRFLQLVGDRTTPIAQKRSATRERLSSELRRELDWIPLMALRKERDRRYASAAGMADDIRRYLDGRPLVAAPDSRMYLARKFVRRNRVQVVAAVAVFVALSGGLAAALWQANEASFQRDEAVAAGQRESEQRKRADERAEAAEIAERAEKERADQLKQVSNFQSQMLAQIDTTTAGVELMRDVRERFSAALEKSGVPEDERAARLEAFGQELVRVNATDAAAALIDRTILKPAINAIDEQFKDQPLVDAQMRQAVADLYVQIGLYDAAMPVQDSALATRSRVLGDQHPSTLESLNDMGALLFLRGDPTEAESYIRRAADARVAVLGSDHPDSIESLGNVGTLLRSQGKLEEAESVYRETMDRYRRVLGNEHGETLRAINNVAFILQERGSYEAAEQFYREALALQRKTLGESHPLTLSTVNNLSQLLRLQGRLAEAEPLAREAVDQQQRTLGEHHPNTLIAVNNLGFLLFQLGKIDEAEPMLQRAISGCRSTLGDDHPTTLSALNNVGQVYAGRGKFSEAERYMRESVLVTERVLGKSNAQSFTAKNNLGYVLQAQGKYAEAEPYMRDAVELSRALLGEGHPNTLIVTTNLASVLARQFKHVEALALAEPLEPVIREKFAGSQEVRIAALLRILGQARAGLGFDADRFSLAEANLLEAHSLFVRTRGDSHKDSRECVQVLIDLYTAWHAAEPDNGYDGKAAEWRIRLEESKAEAGADTDAKTKEVAIAQLAESGG